MSYPVSSTKLLLLLWLRIAVERLSLQFCGYVLKHSSSISLLSNVFFFSFATTTAATTTLRYGKKILIKIYFLCVMKDCLGSERCCMNVLPLFSQIQTIQFLLLIRFRFCSNDFSNQNIMKDFFQEISFFFTFSKKVYLFKILFPCIWDSVSISERHCCCFRKNLWAEKVSNHNYLYSLSSTTNILTNYLYKWLIMYIYLSHLLKWTWKDWKTEEEWVTGNSNKVCQRKTCFPKKLGNSKIWQDIWLATLLWW
jgi:hypothetical protein